jgi:lipoprotein-anchoring transpeptidase ErfK/SrfK
MKIALGRRGILAAAAIAALVVAGGVTTAVSLAAANHPHNTRTVSAAASPVVEKKPAPVSAARLKALPAAVYNAVIPGLLGYEDTHTKTITAAYTIAADIPVYGADQTTPVAKMPAKDFLNQPTVIVPVKLTKNWALILTPARQELPSQAGGTAPAQSAGWVPRAALTKSADLSAAVSVSVSTQTLTITRGTSTAVYKIGVGTANTPTPTGTTGYLQQRFEDPEQASYPIQLTTLHSAAKDEPFGGKDGGLIGMHFNTTNTGAVSHGCIRLTYQATAALNQLPLGTPITITR